MPRHGADVDGLPRVIAKRPPEGSHRLAQRAVGHDYVGPYAIENDLPVNGFVPVLDEEHEEIEIAWDERGLAAAAEQKTLARR